MAATKKNVTGQKKRTAKKEQPRFYAVQSLEKTADTWVKTFKGYNDKYVMKPFETGKDFLDDMRKDPGKAVENLLDDGKKFAGDVRKDPRKVFNRFMDDGKDMADGVKADIQKAFDNVMDGTKDLYRALEKDTRKLMDALTDSREKFLERIPGATAMQKGMSHSLKMLPGWLNLPSKKEMNQLTKTVRTLNARLDTLSKQVAL